MNLKIILGCCVALLALVNPLQKILIVTSLQERFTSGELRYISIKSTVTAAIILIFFFFGRDYFFLCFPGRIVFFSDYVRCCIDIQRPFGIVEGIFS